MRHLDTCVSSFLTFGGLTLCCFPFYLDHPKKFKFYPYLLGFNSMKKWQHKIIIIKNLRIDVQVYVDKLLVQK